MPIVLRMKSDEQIIKNLTMIVHNKKEGRNKDQFTFYCLEEEEGKEE